MSGKQRFLVRTILTFALLWHHLECAPRPGLERPQLKRAKPKTAFAPFNQQKAEEYGKTMSYAELQTPFSKHVSQVYQGVSDPNKVHWIDHLKFEHYVSTGFPNKEGIQFPDGVYDFIVLADSPNQIELLFAGTTMKLSTSNGHSSLLTAQQHKKYLVGQLRIKYAGDLLLKGGRIQWWSACSGHFLSHFLPDQNKYMVFANHWSLPADKFKNVKERGSIFDVSAPVSALPLRSEASEQGQDDDATVDDEEAVIVHMHHGEANTELEFEAMSVLTAVFIVLSCLCALVCVAVGFGLGFGCLLSVWDHKHKRVRGKHLRRMDNDDDDDVESRSASPRAPAYVPVAPEYIPKYAPQNNYVPNYAPMYAPQKSAVEDPVDKDDDDNEDDRVAQAAEPEQNHVEHV